MTGAVRPPYIPDGELNAEQKRIHDAIVSGPRGRVEAPLAIWLHNPELADRAQSLGAFCRFGTSLAPRLSELAILVTAAYWRAGYEWSVHAPIAIDAGLSKEVAEATRTGQSPVFELDDEATVYSFARELLTQQRVSDATYGRAVAILGITATVELVGVLGYYGLISMTICAFEISDPGPATANSVHKSAESQGMTR